MRNACNCFLTRSKSILNLRSFIRIQKSRLTCLNCSSKLQFCCELKFCWMGLELCWDEGVAGWEGGRAGVDGVTPEGGKGLKVVWGGWNPSTDAAVNGTLPWPPNPAKSDCELAKKSLCLLKASKAGKGGKLAKMALGSNSFSSELSSLIRCLASCENDGHSII